MRQEWFAWLVVGMLLTVFPGVAFAQYGAIAGVVKDTTGAVLPGVTVEATSPALIEKVRAGVTSDQGLYRILDLPPGPYVVTFTLPGFSSLKREGIELTTGFTAPVNVELRVGGLDETVLVSGQGPVVDIQNVRQQRVLTREVIDLIPTGSRSFDNLGALVSGMNVSAANGPTGQDVGGTKGNALERLAIHGGRSTDQMQLVDGMWIGAAQALSGSSGWNIFADGSVEEMSLGIAAHSAESETGGVQVNLIPRSGGNIFKGRLFANFANDKLQSSNYTSELKARGLATPGKVNYVFDVNPTLGGPIVRDKLWFFGGFRDTRRANYVANRYPNSSQSPWVYTPDLSQKPKDRQVVKDGIGRVTWQVTPKNKVSAFHDVNDRADPLTPGNPCGCVNLDARSVQNQTALTHLTQATWSVPATNRFAFRVVGSWIAAVGIMVLGLG